MAAFHLGLYFHPKGFRWVTNENADSMWATHHSHFFPQEKKYPLEFHLYFVISFRFLSLFWHNFHKYLKFFWLYFILNVFEFVQKPTFSSFEVVPGGTGSSIQALPVLTRCFWKGGRGQPCLLPRSGVFCVWSTCTLFLLPVYTE